MQNDTANFAAAHSLECFYQNVRGLRSKTHDIFDSIVQSEYDIICLSETWLSSDILDSEICDDRYVPYRNDRNFDLTSKSRGGGVLIAVRSSLMACSINLDSIKESFPNVNIMGLRIGLRGSHFYILTLYVPPNTASDQYEDVLEAISVLPCLLDDNANLIIIGDFNIPDYVTHRETTLRNVRVEAIENFLNFFGLTQCNEVLNANQRLLDLVCSKCPIVVRESLFPLVSIDAHHPPLEFSVASSGKPNKFQKVSFEGYNFRRANLSRLYDMLLTTNWDFLEEFGDINLACDAFYNVLQRVFSECVPRLSERKTSYPPWFTGDIIGRLKVKNKYLRKYKSTGDSQFLDMFRDLRKNLKTEIAGARTDFIHRAEADLSGNPSKFWGYLNTMRGNSSVPGSMNYQNHQLSAPQDIVNAFASFFNSAFIVSSNYQHEESSDISFTQSLAIPEITEDDVLRSLKKCKANMTSGPDGIPSFLLKDCAIILARPLTLIFRLSLSVQCFPIIWREGRVSPVFKKDDKNKIENYRPIVILSNFSKVFERLLYDIVYGHVKCRISDFQHGFIKGRSTITNLTCITQYITSALDDSSQVDVIYTDFSKAFDRLDHGILLKKLSSFGLTESFTRFFESYLTNRRLWVRCLGYRSAEFVASSGVPQGSILGPLLFIVFINDICSHLFSQTLLYVDDCKLFRRIQCVEDCWNLQGDIDALNDWCCRNLLPLNINKCNVVSFSRKKSKVEFHYNVEGHILSRVVQYRDLGLLFDQKLCFTDHVRSIISSGFKTLGFIMRNSGWFQDTGTFFVLFNALVRSKFEYGCVVWSPGYNVHIRGLENIQRRFLKYVSYRVDGVYPNRGIPQDQLLSRFQVDSLERRRTYLGILFLRNLIHSLVDCAYLLSLVDLHVPRLPVRSPTTFYLPFPRSNVLLFSPLYRICHDYMSIQHIIDIFHCNQSDIRRAVLGSLLHCG